MNKFAQVTVQVYQNYFDEIMQELQSLSDRNRDVNSFENLMAKA